MKISSLGRRTDLIFAEFAGEIIDNGNYTVIKTLSNPGYHWGNYIIFDHPPVKGSYKKWKGIFDSEFPHYQTPHHYVFTWDTPEPTPCNYDEFLVEKFEFDSSAVLVSNALNEPRHFQNTPDFELRKISFDSEWEDVIRLQTLCSNPRYFNEQYEQFKRNQMAQYRAMSDSSLGYWFGAYIGGQIVADLGIFHKGNIARYQNIGTHPEHRRRGLCGSLVYKTGQLALKEFDVDTLVMKADTEYHAARIYESVGFKRQEVNYSLSWWRGIEDDTQ